MNRSLGLLLVGGTLFGCDATLQAGRSSPGGDGTSDSSDEAPTSSGTTTEELKSQCDALGDAIVPGPAPLRRLTRAQYNKTVSDLAGDDSSPGDEFPPEGRSLGFHGAAADQSIAGLLAEAYMAAAESVADHATSDLDGLLGCDPAEESCVRDFVSEFGARAYRRPMEPAEIDRLQGVFEWGRENLDVTEGIQMVLEVLLQSPDFLYRPEFGEEEVEEGVMRLSSYEMATRLSYLFTGSMPDEELVRAAAADELNSPEEIEAQTARLLALPGAREMLLDFHSQWLDLEAVEHIERDSSVYQGYTAEIPHLFRQETEAFVEEVLFEADGSLRTLLTAPFTMANDELSNFYGMNAPGTDEFVRVTTSEKRAGVLTHGGILAHHAQALQTSPVHRGLFIRQSLLCGVVSPPPADLEIVPPDLDPSLTTRERFAAHSEEPGCRSCHEYMDPLGLGFEHFDSVGRYREDENGIPIDASGELIATDIDGEFYGAVELGEKLSGSAQVATCMTKLWLRYAQGRSENPEDACTLAQVGESFTESDLNIPSVVTALAQSDTFMYREKVVLP